MLFKEKADATEVKALTIQLYDRQLAQVNGLDDNLMSLTHIVNAHYGKIAANSYVSFYNIYKQKTEEINADLFFCDYLLNHPCFDLAWKLGKPAVGIFSDLSAIRKQDLDVI
ncbi:13145_t:CDS:2 [Gigaspora margarita]|uniref:13145_t:CDS:1 n=1 Tax=Gigaspora margarita TaxID=4874 RepID=A0ABN7V979_GIGMA|nr:13145_t:CDS:2 [Gigaspora margarita]